MEEKQAIVSVIIPIYNTEKYVREAVDSIRSQSLKELEIILINDGSTDGSADVIRDIAAEDSRVRVHTQSNQGLSITRNIGTSLARGKYLYFMDSDDILEADALEQCYLACEEKQLDFVFFDAQIFYDPCEQDTPSLSYQRTDRLEEKLYTGCEALSLQLQNISYTPSACLSFIRRSFLDRIHLQFYPNIVHEDQLFTTLLYLQATRTSCIKRAFFLRRMRPDSIMTRRFTSRNMEGYLTVTQEILRFRKEKASAEEQEVIDHYLSQMLNAAVWQAHLLPTTERIKLAALCLRKYRRYVSLRTICVLLFKSEQKHGQQH